MNIFKTTSVAIFAALSLAACIKGNDNKPTNTASPGKKYQDTVAGNWIWKNEVVWQPASGPSSTTTLADTSFPVIIQRDGIMLAAARTLTYRDSIYYTPVLGALSDTAKFVTYYNGNVTDATYSELTFNRNSDSLFYSITQRHGNSQSIKVYSTKVHH